MVVGGTPSALPRIPEPLQSLQPLLVQVALDALDLLDRLKRGCSFRCHGRSCGEIDRPTDHEVTPPL
jgi:hypothetical protein